MESAAQRCAWCEDQVLFIVGVWQLHAHVSRQIASQNELLNLPIKSLSLQNFGLLFCLSLVLQTQSVPHWHSSLPFILKLWHLQKMRSDIISLQLTASFALQSQNIHNNSDNVWLCPLTPICQCTCVRRKMDMCWEDECRSQPLLSDPDCKSVKALTADCLSSGLQRRKK